MSSSNMDMLKRVELESRGKKPGEVVELNLDNCRSTGEIEGIDDKYSSLKLLSMINVGVTSLKGFPKLPALQKLELSDNRISGTLSCLKHLTTLTHLNLSGNKIKTLDALEPLADLTKLRNLDLFNNDVTKVDEYRPLVFKMIPSLQYLDGFDSENVEAVESDDEDEEASGDEENGNNGNGDHHSDDEDVSDDDENGVGSGESDEEGSEEEIGLDYLTKDNIDEDESDDGDYEEGEEEDEVGEEDDSDFEASGEPPSKVRKQDGGETS